MWGGPLLGKYWENTYILMAGGGGGLNLFTWSDVCILFLKHPLVLTVRAWGRWAFSMIWACFSVLLCLQEVRGLSIHCLAFYSSIRSVVVSQFKGSLLAVLPGEDNVYTVPGTDKKGLIKFLPINIIDLRLFTLLFWISLFIPKKNATGAYGSVTLGICHVGGGTWLTFAVLVLQRGLTAQRWDWFPIDETWWALTTRVK